MQVALVADPVLLKPTLQAQVTVLLDALYEHVAFAWHPPFFTSHTARQIRRNRCPDRGSILHEIGHMNETYVNRPLVKSNPYWHNLVYRYRWLDS